VRKSLSRVRSRERALAQDLKRVDLAERREEALEGLRAEWGGRYTEMVAYRWGGSGGFLCFYGYLRSTKV